MFSSRLRHRPHHAKRPPRRIVVTAPFRLAIYNTASTPLQHTQNDTAVHSRVTAAHRTCRIQGTDLDTFLQLAAYGIWRVETRPTLSTARHHHHHHQGRQNGDWSCIVHCSTVVHRAISIGRSQHNSSTAHLRYADNVSAGSQTASGCQIYCCTYHTKIPCPVQQYCSSKKQY